eukprot:446524-Pyramimonas_sp.AAC.1
MRWPKAAKGEVVAPSQATCYTANSARVIDYSVVRQDLHGCRARTFDGLSATPHKGVILELNVQHAPLMVRKAHMAKAFPSRQLAGPQPPGPDWQEVLDRAAA